MTRKTYFLISHWPLSWHYIAQVQTCAVKRQTCSSRRFSLQQSFSFYHIYFIVSRPRTLFNSASLQRYLSGEKKRPSSRPRNDHDKATPAASPFAFHSKIAHGGSLDKLSTILLAGPFVQVCLHRLSPTGVIWAVIMWSRAERATPLALRAPFSENSSESRALHLCTARTTRIFALVPTRYHTNSTLIWTWWGEKPCKRGISDSEILGATRRIIQGTLNGQTNSHLINKWARRQSRQDGI